MAQIDRLTGLVGNTGCKVPVRVATTAAITLSGEQTVDGVAVVTDDRVLVKNQASGVDNGIYVVDTGDWSRAPDFDGTYDIVRGSIVRVNEGSSNVGSFWEITTADPITIGTTSITFGRVSAFSVSLSSQVAAAGQTLFNLGTTYATGSQAIAVFVNGLRQRLSADYNETSVSSITFTYALQVNDEVDVYIGQSLGNLTAAAATLVAVTDAGDFYLGTTVEAVLQEIRDAITADNGDTSQVLAYSGSTSVQRWNTPLTATRTATLSTANAREGAHFVIIRGSGATGNFGLLVGALCTLWAPGSYAEVRYDAGTGAWVLEKQGLLESGAKVGITVDNGDASVTLTVGSSYTEQRWLTALTADRTATLATVGASIGSRFRVVRDEAATGAFSLIVTGAAQLIRLAPGQWANLVYTGTAWIVAGFGNLRPGLTSLIEMKDDFLGEEINGYWWQGWLGTDSNARNATMRADQLGGVIRMTTGSDAGATMALNGVQVQGQLNWRASKGGLVWEGRVAIDAITLVALYIGLTDQRSALEMPFTLAAGDALTSNATDAVGVLFDTGADTDNWWLVGVAADIDAAKQNTAVAPVAGTFETWRIEVSATGVATFYRNGTLVGATMAGAVTPGTQLTPVVAAFSRTNASRNVDIDMISLQQQR